MSKIDITKPLQLSDGRKVTFAMRDEDGIGVDVAGDYQTRWFSHTGRHLFGSLPQLQNVPELDLNAPLFTKAGVPVALSDLTNTPPATVEFFTVYPPGWAGNPNGAAMRSTRQHVAAGWPAAITTLKVTSVSGKQTKVEIA